MAIQKKSDQQLYTSRGPLDSKSLVKTYADLTSLNTWTVDDTLVAYNGMIVAVWLDKTDDTNNGIYYLYDPLVTTALKKPDPTVVTNWHKISDKIDTSVIESTLADHESRLKAVEEKTPVETYGYRSGFPTTGEENKLYVAVDEGKTYIWFDGNYLAVGGSDYEEPTIIFGGSAEK